MDLEQAVDLVAGILTRKHVEFQTRPDGREHQARYGSTAAFIRFDEKGDDTIVSVVGTVVEDLPLQGANGRRKLLERLNEINVETYFGKFVLHNAEVRVEHDLLASRMQGDELMNALTVVVRLSDEWDDRLKEEFGGQTWQEK